MRNSTDAGHGAACLADLAVLAGSGWCGNVLPVLHGGTADSCGHPEAVNPLYRLLENKYYLDELYFAVFAKGSRLLGTGFWKAGDQTLIDGLVVNGSAKAVGALAAVTRKLQTGFIYSYATAMVIGVLVLLTVFVVGV